MRRIFLHILLIVSAIFSFSPAAFALSPVATQPASQPATSARQPLAKRGDTYRILFIGNSFTSANDLPKVFAALARAAGEQPPIHRTLARGGVSLEDHLARPDTVRVLKSEPWDLVILQQGPSARDTTGNLKTHAARFAELIRAAGGQPALFMVWPDRRLLDTDLEPCSQNYRTSAEHCNALLFPVGEALAATLRAEPTTPLYAADQFHPSPTGTYLAALVMFEQIYGRSPIGLPAKLHITGDRTLSIPPAVAARVQQAAFHANAQFAPPRPRPDPQPPVSPGSSPATSPQH